MIRNLTVVILGLALLNGWMYLQQPAMAFFPHQNLTATPADWELDYEDVTLLTEDGVPLHGWYIPAAASDQTLLFFHGNGGNISHRRQSIEIFHHLGLNVFIFDYRGYGHSQGTPSEQGLYLDAATAWNYLTETREATPENIIIFGRSLGGSVAAQLAAKVKPRALILESTLSSARDMASELFPLLSRLVVMRYDFNTARDITRISCPVLVLHSPDDQIIPFELGRKVFAAAHQPKQFMALKGGHNNGFTLSQPGYEQTLKQFLGI